MNGFHAALSLAGAGLISFIIFACLAGNRPSEWIPNEPHDGEGKWHVGPTHPSARWFLIAAGTLTLPLIGRLMLLAVLS